VVHEMTVLIVDDNREVLNALAPAIRAQGYEVLTAANGQEALSILKRNEVDIGLFDLSMPGMDGIELLSVTKSLRAHVEVIVMSATGTIQDAVASMKQGAFDFIIKPFRTDILANVLHNASEKRKLIQENIRLREMIEAREENPHIVGTSPAFRASLEIVRQVAPTSATVLVVGESGTGKEVVADLIHKLSPRASNPLVKVSCAALPETLLEAELFGHEKGAYTGAVVSRVGRFEMADGGTLFLDEIGEISPALQVKLLRFLQSGEYERIGDPTHRKADVRVVAATNADLTERIEKKQFREDLYYRLNVITLRVPSLRERKGDVELLAVHFLKKFATRNDKSIQGFSKEALQALSTYPWPGNVRELENVMERAVILAKGNLISPEDFPQEIGDFKERMRSIQIPLGMPLHEVKEKLVKEALEHTGGNKAEAAKLLGITRRTIYRHLSPSHTEEG